MRIGVDATCLANGRGYGRFARELLRELVPMAPNDEFIFFADDRAADKFDVVAPNVRMVRVAQSVSPTEAAAADGARSPADMLRFTRAVWREPLDVFFSPSVYTYFPLPPGLRAVVTVHDAIAERFPEMTLPSKRARLFWKLKVGLALKQSRIVLTVSDFSARDIAAILGVSPSRIRVAVEAPAAAYRPSETAAEIANAAARLGVPAGRRWFVYVGGFGAHKRIDAIVRAHAAVAKTAGDRAPYLLLAGTLTDDVFLGDGARIRAEIEKAGTGDLVKWTGFVPDDELRHIMSGSLALLLPSECEGFGLPAVEAAACGTPVIATTMSPLPELLAGGGIFVEPRDEQALVDGMRRMFDEEPARQAMGARALERAGQLSWAASARATLGALREAAA
jgi:glycosyltransferase involved in cell wall biosynthesis